MYTDLLIMFWQPEQICQQIKLLSAEMQIQGPLLNGELVNSSHLLIVQNMLSTERIEVLLSKFPLDNVVQDLCLIVQVSI